jgi:hypothetical protein
MWSGPRNISTAMMRAFGNRPDTAVCDEPFYARYLQVTGAPHPGRAEVIASQDTDWRRVVAMLTGPVPDGKAIFYQKHMTHHLLPDIGRDWLDEVMNCFLIRDPQSVLASLDARYPNPTVRDTGLPQQREIFDFVMQRMGRAPPVIDAADVLANPRALLEKLCDRLRIPFTDRMLQWPAGPRDTDGVWAKHWYDSVWESTGFRPLRDGRVTLPARLAPILDRCQRHYDVLYSHRILP